MPIVFSLRLTFLLFIFSDHLPVLSKKEDAQFVHVLDGAFLAKRVVRIVEFGTFDYRLYCFFFLHAWCLRPVCFCIKPYSLTIIILKLKSLCVNACGSEIKSRRENPLRFILIWEILIFYLGGVWVGYFSFFCMAAFGVKAEYHPVTLVGVFSTLRADSPWVF